MTKRELGGIRRGDKVMRKVNTEDYAETIIRAIPKGVLLTTKADKVNSMVIGWGSYGVEWGRPIFAVYVREGRFTREQLDANPEFTVNIPLQEFDRSILKICGSQSGRSIDKLREAGLTPVKGEAVSVPGIRELPLTLECRVVFRQKQELELIDRKFMGMYPQDVPGTDPMANRDAHIAYYGEILNAYIAE